MKKFIIEHRDLIIKVTASSNNTNIEDSYRITRTENMKHILELIRTNCEGDYSINKRSINNMVREWKGHNFVYSLNIAKDRTGSVDLEYPQKWYVKFIYYILSFLYFFIKK